MANRMVKTGSSDRFYLLGSKITADGDCTHEIKRHLLLGRKVMTDLDSVSKITWPNKASHWRNYVFILWYWRRLLRDPRTAWRSNQSILREINPEYSLEGLMLKLKLQYFGHLIWRADSLEKTLMLGKIEGKRRRRQQRMRRLDSITDSTDMNFIKLQEITEDRNLACYSPWGHRVRHDLAAEQQQAA